MSQKVFMHRVNKTFRVRPSTESPGTGEVLLGNIDHDDAGNNDFIGYKGSHVLYQHIENLCIKYIAGVPGTVLNYPSFKIIGYKPVTGVYAGDPFTVTVAAGPNKTKQLAPTVIPADTSESKAVTYASSDATKATVSAQGLVTGIAVGTATITVTTGSGSKTGTVLVTVVAS